MKSRLATLFAAILGLLLFSARSARATTIRSGSGYGQVISYSSCVTDVNDFNADGTENNCIGVQSAPFTIDGDPVYQFAFVGGQNGTETAAIYDVVDFGAVASGTSVDLPVLDATALTGVFGCGHGSIVEDSMGATVNVPCTPDSLLASVSQNGADFTATGAISDLALFTLDGNLNTGSVATPEPSSFPLLGIGLMSLFLVARRRLQV